MAALARRNWYLAALTLALGAIATQLVSKHHAGLGMTTTARGAEASNFSRRYADSGNDTLASAEADESRRLRQVGFRHAGKAALWGNVSLILAILATLYWPSAWSHRESGTRRMLIALLAVYGLLFLLVV
jgi:hypothetical protein